MALRMVEVYLPDGRATSDFWEAHPTLGRWSFDVRDGGRLVRALLNTEDTEAFLNALDDELGHTDDYRIVMQTVEATIPRPEASPEPAAEPQAELFDEAEAPSEPSRKLSRISTEELYTDITESIRSGSIYYVLIVLSTVVAAGGLMLDDGAVVIGAMVIAPLIGPNMALALGTTLGDTHLVVRALKANILGISLAFAMAVGVGLLFDFDPETPQIASRTSVGLGSVALALASGVAGALSFTRGTASALIGVMVAVALLPPLVVVGMMLGAGFERAALGAFVLLLVNIASVNLAAVATFLVQGVRPNRWYEAEDAKRATRKALALWLIVLAILVATILLAPEGFIGL